MYHCDFNQKYAPWCKIKMKTKQSVTTYDIPTFFHGCLGLWEILSWVVLLPVNPIKPRHSGMILRPTGADYKQFGSHNNALFTDSVLYFSPVFYRNIFPYQSPMLATATSYSQATKLGRRSPPSCHSCQDIHGMWWNQYVLEMFPHNLCDVQDNGN